MNADRIIIPITEDDQGEGFKECQTSESPLSDLLDCLKYHEDAIDDAIVDYQDMCEPGGDDYGICGLFLSLIEQHRKFATAIRAAVKAI